MGTKNYAPINTNTVLYDPAEKKLRKWGPFRFADILRDTLANTVLSNVKALLIEVKKIPN